MQKKILLATAVLLLSTTVFVANYSRAQSAHSDVDPNVSALSISLKSSNCYGHDNGKEYTCTPTTSSESCALCDDEVIITPPEPDKEPEVPAW